MLLKHILPFTKLRFQSSRVLTILLVLITSTLIITQIGHLYKNSDLISSSKIKQISIEDDLTTTTEEVIETPKPQDKTAEKEKPKEEAAITEPTKDEKSKEEESKEETSKQETDDDEYFKNQIFDYDYSDTKQIDELLNKNHEMKSWIKSKLLDIITQAKPSAAVINDKKHYNKENPFIKTWDSKMPVTAGKLRENNIVDPIRSKDYLASFLQLSEDEIISLRNSHQQFLDNMPTDYPDSFKKHLKGNGILYAGGGNYNWLVLISIKMLRDLGSKLPVEVFIPTDNEYSIELCENVFPILGAKCIVMSNYIDTKQFKLRGYQLKSMALLLTSFENVLMLDSDNIPVANPDHIFTQDPFISKGLVVWPDFWRRSTSPTYYDIVGIKVNETNQVRYSYNDDRDHPKDLKTIEDYNSKISYHDLEGTFPESSSESGQILINKKTHVKAIFLSLYYNYFGPNYYYGLMSQGQAGEGDKETILASAHRLNLPYYQVQEYIREYGLIRDDGGIEIASMGQYDPVIDFKQSSDYDKYKSNFPYDASKDNYWMHKFKESKTLFLHCNQPKLYPWNVAGKGLVNFLNVKDGVRRRLYSGYLNKELGYDFEVKIWEIIRWLLCEHGDLNIKGMKDPSGWCKKVNDQIQFLATDLADEDV